jgi:hypothetical protein
MADIEITFNADEAGRRVAAVLEGLPADLLTRLRPTFERLTAELLAKVRAGEPHRTGALEAATQAFVDDIAGVRLRGRVRVLAEPGQKGRYNIKAAALEYGAHGPARVSAHERLLDHVYATPIAAEEVMVAAYERDVNVTAWAFLRDAFGGMQSEFEAEVERTLAAIQRDSL